MIIGLCGLAGSGKDTAAAILCRRHGFAAVAFADPLYAAVSEITGLPLAKLKDRVAKEAALPWLGKSPRELLQTLGTEWGRQMVRDDIWIKIAMRRASEHERSGRHVAITDVRFENEAEAIRHAGGYVWRIERPDAGLCGAAGEHSSEAGIPHHLINQVVRNVGTLDDLEEAVNAAFHSLPCVTMEVSTP
jgi:predicted kinase